MKDADIETMRLEPRHTEALDRAERWMFHSDFCPYLELKALLPDATPDARERFRVLFTAYYGLNVGGLTEEFKDNYFRILFSDSVILDGCPAYSTILKELGGFKRKKGDRAMPFSFVSKLVAMRLESRPIYDRHVLAFFGKKSPAASVDMGERIDWYVRFLDHVRSSYAAWANEPMVMPILERLKDRDDRLRCCHDVRLLDFLVWKVGNRKLLT